MVVFLKRNIKISTKARKDTAYNIWCGHKLNILPRCGRHIQLLVTTQRSLKLLAQGSKLTVASCKFATWKSHLPPG